LSITIIWACKHREIFIILLFSQKIIYILLIIFWENNKIIKYIIFWENNIYYWFFFFVQIFFKYTRVYKWYAKIVVTIQNFVRQNISIFDINLCDIYWIIYRSITQFQLIFCFHVRLDVIFALSFFFFLWIFRWALGALYNFIYLIKYLSFNYLITCYFFIF